MKISEDFSHIADFELSTQITISMSFRLCKLKLAPQLAPRSERSRINEPEPDHLKGMQS